MFNKLYKQSHQLLLDFMRKHHSDIPVSIQNDINSLVGQVILICTEIYKANLLKLKYNLDIDMTSSVNNQDPAGSYIQKYLPCEVCGNVRVANKCHIIPRNDGGNDDPDNILTLCANHHHLFDRYKLTETEWKAIKWDNRAPKIREYAYKVAYPRHQMYWKYHVPYRVCECGGQDFEISLSERPAKRFGSTVYFPGSIDNSFKCKACGVEYVDCKYKDYEFEWWQNWVIEKARNESSDSAEKVTK